MLLLKVLTLFGVALVAGGWMMGTFLVTPAQTKLSASEYTAVEQANTKYGERYFPMVQAITVILLVTLLILTLRNKQSVVLIAASLVFLIAGVAFTAARMIPLNKQMDAWSIQSPPSDWQNARDAWHTNHRIRTVLAVTAFLLLSTALVHGSASNDNRSGAAKKTQALKSSRA